MNLLRRLMAGRNGIDQLSVAMVILGLLLNLIGVACGVPLARGILGTIDYLLLVVVIFRTISRNIYRRQSENQRFLAATGRIRSALRLRGRMLREARQYRYLKCPQCAQRLRVPRGKGRIRVSCAKCGERFEAKV